MSVDFKTLILDGRMTNFRVVQGDSARLSTSDEYITGFGFYLPASEQHYWNRETTLVSQGYKVVVSNKLVNGPEDDPLYNFCTQNRIGVNIPGCDMVSLLAISDHKGIYPAWFAEVTVFHNICHWKDESTTIDEVLGPPPLQDKVVALRAWNDAAKSLSFPKSLSYDDVTLYGMNYITRSGQIVLINVTALASNTAYRTKVREYLLNDNLLEAIRTSTSSHTTQNIDCESDLLELAINKINEVLVHHIENRHWIEAFWDGRRKVKFDGQQIEVPSQPKSEIKIQPTLGVLLFEMFHPHGIHVTRESSEGVGDLDFKLSFTTVLGRPVSVCIEFKLAHHRKLSHGLETQLPNYLSATRTKSGIYLVLWFKDKKAKFFDQPREYSLEQTRENLLTIAEKVGTRSGIRLVPIVIDSSIRVSASVDDR